MADGQSLRDLFDRYHEEIVYVALDTDSIRRDLDVPAEYDALRRGIRENRIDNDVTLEERIKRRA